MFSKYIVKFFIFILLNIFLYPKSIDLNKLEDYSKNFKHMNNTQIINASIDNASYLLGSGDRIAINFSANDIILNNVLTVSHSNDLIIPNIGMINVKGMTVEGFIRSLNDLCKKKFDIYELNITLTELRKFNVVVSGINNSSYHYSVTHLTRVSDLINNIKKTNLDFFDKISERNITLKRNDIISNIDVLMYNSILSGYNPYLLENDLIVLNKKEMFYEIVGEVKNPGPYEYVNLETLKDALELSGGLLKSANVNAISILRKGNDNKINIKLENIDDYSILPNDYILIGKDSSIQDLEYAYIFGSIYNPGKYPVFDNTTIGDIISFSNGFKPNADTNKILINNDVFKKNIDIEFIRISNILPQNRSSSEISYFKSRLMLDRGSSRSNQGFSTQNLLDSKVNNNDFIFVPSLVHSVEILGAINAPGNYTYKEDYTALDYIKESGSFTNLSNGKYFVINTSGEKKQIDMKYSDFKAGDILFIEQKADVNRWIKFKEIMSVLGQIATILVVVRQ